MTANSIVEYNPVEWNPRSLNCIVHPCDNARIPGKVYCEQHFVAAGGVVLGKAIKILSRTQIEATKYRADGNFWCADKCSRCDSTFYTHAMQNRPWGWYADPICPWCCGKCSAAEQDRHNTKIEAER